jgi:TorA maturation chaperone TorD
MIIENRKNLLKGYNMLLYFAGSMISSEPTEECIIDFWTYNTLERLPVLSPNPRFLKAASLLRYPITDEEKFRQMLSDDYSILFSESGLLLASARTSTYLVDEKRRMTIENEITEFYNAYGWKPGNPGKHSDYLGIELLFLTKLIDMYLTLDDPPSCREMKKEICRFINNYILSWISLWDEDIREYAHNQCYKGISTLIYACAEDLYGIFSNGEVLENN